MHSLRKDTTADAKMVGGVVGILITLIIAVLVFYNIAGSIDSSTADEAISSALGHSATNNTDATNATDDILDQSATFFTIAPIIAIVVVAVVILKYVGQI